MNDKCALHKRVNCWSLVCQAHVAARKNQTPPLVTLRKPLGQ